jgi:hypothetical protein
LALNPDDPVLADFTVMKLSSSDSRSDAMVGCTMSAEQMAMTLKAKNNFFPLIFLSFPVKPCNGIATRSISREMDPLENGDQYHPYYELAVPRIIYDLDPGVNMRTRNNCSSCLYNVLTGSEGTVPGSFRAA